MLKFMTNGSLECNLILCSLHLWIKKCPDKTFKIRKTLFFFSSFLVKALVQTCFDETHINHLRDIMVIETTISF